MSIYQKVNQTKMVQKLFWINFPEGCLSLTEYIHITNLNLQKNTTCDFRRRAEGGRP